MYANNISKKMYTGFSLMVIIAMAILAGIALNRVNLAKAVQLENGPAQSEEAFTDRHRRRGHTFAMTADVLKEKVAAQSEEAFTDRRRRRPRTFAMTADVLKENVAAQSEEAFTDRSRRRRHTFAMTADVLIGSTAAVNPANGISRLPG